MYDLNMKHQFIEQRATDWSLFRIAAHIEWRHESNQPVQPIWSIWSISSKT
jgi:hypothetical protein